MAKLLVLIFCGITYNNFTGEDPLMLADENLQQYFELHVAILDVYSAIT